MEMRVFRPANLRELLSYIYLNPEASLVAGGTDFLRCVKNQERSLPEKLVDLNTVSELKKINKTMRYLDLGSVLSLSRILSIRYHVVPRVLHAALKSIGSPSIRNLATLGGNICLASPYSSAIPALCVLDAHMEIRSYTAFRWEPVAAFIKPVPVIAEVKDGLAAESGAGERGLAGPGEGVLPGAGRAPACPEFPVPGAKKAAARLPLVATSLARDEIVARIRIPLDSWNVQVFKKITTGYNSPQSAVIFCGLAQLSKGVIEDFRFALGAVNRLVYRNRNLEKPFIGRKVPLLPKDIELLKEALAANLEPIEDRVFPAEYRKKTALNLLEWFLKSLKPG